MRPSADHLKGRSFTRVADWSPDDLTAVLDLAVELKALQHAHTVHRLLPGRSLAMIFVKPSMRTRVSFELAISQLGGTAVYLPGHEIGLGKRETTKDMAHVLSRYVDALMIRTFAQEEVEEFARWSSVPVINGLTDEEHPCQALADLLTIRERLGELEGVRFAYIGDGNNMAVSLMAAAVSFGMHFVAATPPGFELPAAAVAAAAARAAGTGGSVETVVEPHAAAAGADVLYTDVWTSMGQEAETAARLQAFAGYTVDDALVGLASSRSIVLHCLPAHYGEEIAESVLYGPRSAVWDQAENRLHAQKALLALVVR